MKQTTKLIGVLALGAFVLGQADVARAADANPPERMTYQGYLADVNGDALGKLAPTNYDTVFRVYAAKQDGDALWAEQQTITVDKGYFSVLLGEGSQYGSELHGDLSDAFDGLDASDRFIGITVDVGGVATEITPRLRLVASPYAFMASQARRLTDGSGNSNFFKDDTSLKLGAGSTPTLTLPEAGGASLVGKLTVNLTGWGVGLQVVNGEVSTTFGAEDSSVFHFNTGLPGFYFNKEITVAGDIHSYNTDTILGPSDNTDTYLKVHNGSDKITAQADEFLVQGDSKYLQMKFTSTAAELRTDADSIYMNKPLDVNGRIQDKTGFVSPVGSVIAFAGSTAPDGWLLCDGSNYSSANYPDLYAVIGTSFGSTGGYFHVPDLRTRVPVGLSSSDTQFQEIGDVGGEVDHTLTVAEMPSHSHQMQLGVERDDSGGGGSYNEWTQAPNGTPPSTSETGGSASHNNMPPFVVMNYIIKY
jgi:microcystin-dependent protein